MAVATTDADRTSDDPEVPERASQRRYPASYEARILAEYEALDREGKGALLRREGLCTSLVSDRRKQRDRGALEAGPSRWDDRPSTRWSARTPACAGRTSASPPSSPRPAG